jgi:hypothetical protein
VTFLAKLAALIILPVLNWLYDKIKGIVRLGEINKKIEDEAKTTVQPLKDAKTAEEIDHATDSALDKF